MYISAPIRPSKQKYLVYGGFVLTVFVLSLALGLGVGYLLLCVASAIALFWSEGLKPKPVYLLSPQGSDDLWQASVATADKQVLWQFYVNKLDDFGICVVLQGFVAEPINKHIRWVIFKDMMDFESYRTLRALARFG